MQRVTESRRDAVPLPVPGDGGALASGVKGSRDFTRQNNTIH